MSVLIGIRWMRFVAFTAFILCDIGAQGQVTYPPTLADGKTLVTDTSPDFLKPPATLKPGVASPKPRLPSTSCISRPALSRPALVQLGERISRGWQLLFGHRRSSGNG